MRAALWCDRAKGEIGKSFATKLRSVQFGQARKMQNQLMELWPTTVELLTLIL
jgi:hypothetical protein